MKKKRDKKEKFMALYGPVHDRFERFCTARAYGSVDPKDLMHDTILIAYEKLDTVDDPKAFLHFLFGISIRVLANSNRKLRPLHTPEEYQAFQVEDASMDPEKSDDVNLLYHGLAQLPEAQREALVLFEISGFSIAEIADLQEIGISAVKQRLARGRKALLEVLSAEEVPHKKIVGL